MDSIKAEKLKKTLELSYEVGLWGRTLEKASLIYADDMFCLGTNIDEIGYTAEDLVNYIKRNKVYEQKQQINIENIDAKTIFAKSLADDAIFIGADEITMTFRANNQTFKHKIWASSVLEYKDDEWRFLKTHIAFPADAENDPWLVHQWEKEKERLEMQIRDRTLELEAKNKELSETIQQLKAAQDQLVQQEKLASLGQLTAGIAHEIKNPLNFVNNFSEVSVELIEEAREEVRQVTEGRSERRETEDRGPGSEKSKVKSEKSGDAISEKNKAPSIILEILDDIEGNLRKIHEHGSRADGIVKSMLQHSRGGDGKMEPTPLNPLIKEYVNLAFHGMRAGKEPIDVDIDVQLDDSVGKVQLVAEDFSRVILNLCNNAFDACAERSRSAIREKMTVDSGQLTKSPFEGGGEQSEQGDDSSLSYQPKLTVRTKSDNGKVMIEIEDNGPGIPDDIKDKIMQPFFTTKKGTQGTGLGLSITNDIIKAHGGTLHVSSSHKGSSFTIQLQKQGL